jgi:hypothetical protein
MKAAVYHEIEAVHAFECTTSDESAVKVLVGE